MCPAPPKCTRSAGAKVSLEHDSFLTHCATQLCSLLTPFGDREKRQAPFCVLPQISGANVRLVTTCTITDLHCHRPLLDPELPSLR